MRKKSQVQFDIHFRVENFPLKIVLLNIWFRFNQITRFFSSSSQTSDAVSVCFQPFPILIFAINKKSSSRRKKIDKIYSHIADFSPIFFCDYATHETRGRKKIVCIRWRKWVKTPAFPRVETFLAFNVTWCSQFSWRFFVSVVFPNFQFLRRKKRKI